MKILLEFARFEGKKVMKSPYLDVRVHLVATTGEGESLKNSTSLPNL